MEKIELPSQQRISKSTKRSMIGLAVLLDLLPILAAMVLFGVVLYNLSDSMSDVASIKEANDRLLDDCLEMPESCGAQAGVAAYHASKLLAKGAAGGFTIVLGIPVVYIAVSFFASTIGYLIFTIWFFLKKINIWSFGSGKRAIINLLTVVVENIPGLDLLPGITLMVWGHVKIAELEDKLKEKEFGKKVVKALNT